MTQKQKFLLLGIIVLAVFLRFYKIQEMPGGLFPDEAANGLDINLMQQGELQPFYERGNGREALFFYLLWASVEIFGKGHWQHHIVSALVGSLAVLVCFLVARRIFLTKKMILPEKESQVFSANILPSAVQTHAGAYETFDKASLNYAANIGLLSAFFMAVSTWHITLSRTAFRANLIPLFTGLVLYFGLRAFQEVKTKTRFFYSFLCGASFALGFYSYIAYRIMVPILAMIILWPLLAKLKERKFGESLRGYKAAFLVFLFAFIIFILPLAQYFYTHPGSFVGRSGQVSVFNPELNQGNLPVAIWQVLKESLFAYFFNGDLNWRHNISGFPFLSEILSPFFAGGLILVSLMAVGYFLFPIRRAGWWKYFLLTGWFWGMLLPVITTAEGIPHGLRAIGTIPAVFIISGWAVYEFARLLMKLYRKVWAWSFYHYNDPEWLKDRHFIPWRMRLVTFSLKFVAVCFFVTLTLQAYILYFVYASASPENFYSFRSDLTEVSKYLKERCNGPATYLILDKFSVQTTDYLTSNDSGDFKDKCSIPYLQVDPENAWELPRLKLGDQIVFTQSSIFDIKKFKSYHPETKLVKETRNKFGQAMLAVYERR